MIEAVGIAVLAVVALVYVSGPLRNPPAPAPADTAAEPPAAARKQAALVAILDLEEERDLGKLSETDLVELRSRYESEAIAALRELDALGAADDSLEAEIAAARERIACPHCGTPRVSGEPCPRCGE